MKYTFKSEAEKEDHFMSSVPASVTVEFNADTLENIIQNFEQFLRGSGFHFNGIIDIVPLDEDPVFVNDNNFNFERGTGSFYGDATYKTDIPVPGKENIQYEINNDELSKTIRININDK